MNLSKFLLIAVLVTVVALAYVHQQIELVRLSYTINRNNDDLLVLLDQNSSLMYNVGSLEAPFYLAQTLAANEVNIEIPSRWHTIAFAEAETVE